jgi:hypothetical protein
MMKEAERNLVVAETLIEVVSALNEGAAGPTHYWFNELAKQLTKRAQELNNEAKRILDAS